MLPPRRFVTATNSYYEQPIKPNLLKKNFTPNAANQRWVTDIASIPTDKCWFYIAAIMDFYSRRCYDHAVAENFWHTRMNEWIHRTIFHPRAQAKAGSFDSIETFYHHTRRHAAIGNLRPMNFELQPAQAA